MANIAEICKQYGAQALTSAAQVDRVAEMVAQLQITFQNDLESAQLLKKNLLKEEYPIDRTISVITRTSIEHSQYPQIIAGLLIFEALFQANVLSDEELLTCLNALQQAYRLDFTTLPQWLIDSEISPAVAVTLLIQQAE